MHTIRSLIELCVPFLEKKGIQNARRCADELLASLMDLGRMELYFDFDRPVIEHEVNQYRELIKRKGEGEPLEYILGAVDFMGCNLKVTPDVLIPRPETEILVSNIIPSLQENQVLFDLCTGSGCIGLALKQACPTLQVTLSDISPEALAIAAENAQRNELRVELLEGDLFAPFAGKKADIITCNPPYLAAHEERPADEPTLALVGGESGYEFFERIASEAPPYLNPGAKLFFEIGTNQGARIEEIFSESHWNQVNCEQDWAGHDRFFSLEFS